MERLAILIVSSFLAASCMTEGEKLRACSSLYHSEPNWTQVNEPFEFNLQEISADEHSTCYPVDPESLWFQSDAGKLKLCVVDKYYEELRFGALYEPGDLGFELVEKRCVGGVFGRPKRILPTKAEWDEIWR